MKVYNLLTSLDVVRRQIVTEDKFLQLVFIHSKNSNGAL